MKSLLKEPVFVVVTSLVTNFFGGPKVWKLGIACQELWGNNFKHCVGELFDSGKGMRGLSGVRLCF